LFSLSKVTVGDRALAWGCLGKPLITLTFLFTFFRRIVSIPTNGDTRSKAGTQPTLACESCHAKSAPSSYSPFSPIAALSLSGGCSVPATSATPGRAALISGAGRGKSAAWGNSTLPLTDRWRTFLEYVVAKITRLLPPWHPPDRIALVGKRVVLRAPTKSSTTTSPLTSMWLGLGLWLRTTQVLVNKKRRSIGTLGLQVS
jgi:hypothetical protein